MIKIVKGTDAMSTVPPSESLMRNYHCRRGWLKKIFETPKKGDWSAATNMRW